MLLLSLKFCHPDLEEIKVNIKDLKRRTILIFILIFACLGVVKVEYDRKNYRAEVKANRLRLLGKIFHDPGKYHRLQRTKDPNPTDAAQTTLLRLFFLFGNNICLIFH